MDFDPSSFWNSILEKVKKHIPTIDFDFSPNENEEIVTVYQRPPGLSLKVPEDFDSFSVEDAELEKLLKPQTCWSEAETCRQRLKLDDDDTEAGACQSTTVDITGAKLETSAKPHVDSTKSDVGFPVLSFVRLDQWDLDNVLQNLKEDELSLCQHASVEPENTHANDKCKCRSKGDIMERLVALCESQLSKSVSEPLRSPNHIKEKNVWNESLENMAAELELSHQECPTVYIDLRCPDPSIKPPRTSPNLSSKSPAKYNTGWVAPPAMTPNLKLHTRSRTGDREVTGKSLLLQKIREMNQNGNTYPNKRTDPPDSAIGNEAEELKNEPLLPVESACGHDSQHVWVDKQSSPVQYESREPKMESPPTVQQSSVKEPKQQSDPQRKQLKCQQHQQILKQLETHCPTKSVYQKQPAAERTGVLYDFEASHLPPINTLPQDIENKGRMLLIVNLSGPGMVRDRARGKRNPAATKSHIYNTLVVWFLSLVGRDALSDENEGDAIVPFWVAGIQQLWTGNGLVLHVLAVARHCYTPRKRNIDIHAPFYNHVCRFLTETSLAQIASWLPELEILLDQQAFASPIHLPPTCLNTFISATFDEKVRDRAFGLSPGFYWQTVETQEHVCKGRETTQELHTEVSVALGCSDFFLHPVIAHYVLQLVSDSGLDVCGLRLLYPPGRLLSDSTGSVAVNQGADEICKPVLALAVRGPHAHSLLKELTPSLDSLLPKKTNPVSVSSLHLRSQELPNIYSPPLAGQVHQELCLWFSGRFQRGSAQNHNQPLSRAVPLDNTEGDSLFNLSGSSAFLCATTKADVLLVVSPVVPPCCYGQVLAVCECRGFGLRGLQRLQLQSNAAAVLGLTNQQANVFCTSSAVTLGEEELELPCLVLLLRKENAVHHSVSLPAALMREFKVQKLLGCVDSRLNGVHTAEPCFCFHTVPYSSNLLHILGRCMWTVPDPSCVILSHQKCPSNPDTEQVVILTLCGKDMSQGLSLLHRLLTEGPGCGVHHAPFQLLGLKWLPVLTRFQAQELSPYEVGEQLCHSTQDCLMSYPALVCALRHIDAFASLQKLLLHDYPGSLSVLMSSTPEVALRQACLFFFEHEMIPDPQMLLTVCLFKPRVWHHALTEIFHKLQQRGLVLVGLRVITLDKSDAAALLPAENEPSDSECLCSGSSLALCLQGEKAVRKLQDMLSHEDSSPWTNCYGSGSHQKATEDVKRLFPHGQCCTETTTMRQEQILSMCSDPFASLERQQSCTLAPVAQETLSPSNASGPNGGSVIHSPVWQTTCLLIPLNAPPLNKVPPQLEMLQQLLRSGCHLVAGRMSVLDDKQRQHIAETLKVSSGANERCPEKTTHLHMTPCLIVALQGKKTVTGFNFILESIYKDRPDLEKVGELIVYPGSEKEANQLICYLFDALPPESCQAIVPLKSKCMQRCFPKNKQRL